MKNTIKIMNSFFKSVFATMLGGFFLFLVFFLILIGVISAIASSGNKKILVEKESVLYLDLSQPVVERTSKNPFENMNYFSGKTNKPLGINDITQAIANAKTDDRIKGILINAAGVNADYASIEPIRNAIDSFKRSGKFIYAFGDNIPQNAYYLASAADSVFINPVGGIDFRGIYLELMFFKKALDKLDVEVQIVRHGKFKSAIEPFILEKMSDENRRQMQQLASGIWGHLLDRISDSRKIPVDTLNKVADSLFAFDAGKALQYKLVDGIIYRDELDSRINKRIGHKSDESLRLVSMNDYITDTKWKNVSIESKRIAVIYAYGDITMNQDGSGGIGGIELSRTIRKAVTDSTIKAIVLRVNSPGGDALASEMIWREVSNATKIKPVVVSMGTYAASGGYYISCAASYIFAEPTTITGSIGVFGMIPNFQKLMNDRVGITTDGISTNANSEYLTTSKAMSPFTRQTIQKEIEKIYGIFIKRVGDGRKMDISMVDSIGQGRVWSGIDGKKLGLVDELGGLNAAIGKAAKLAKLDKYEIVELPKQKEFLDELIASFTETEVSEQRLQQVMGQYYVLYKTLVSVKRMSNIQARLPFVVNFN